jgi:hypothetical protein
MLAARIVVHDSSSSVRGAAPGLPGTTEQF